MKTNRREFLFGAKAVSTVWATGCVTQNPQSSTLNPQPVLDENLSVLLSDIHLQTDPAKAYAFTAQQLPKRVAEILAMRPMLRLCKEK